MVKTTTKSQLDEELRQKIVAYANVFSKENQFTAKVLADLAKFCRANESTFHQDPRVHAVAEGRREVWLLIQNYLNLSIEELYEVRRVKQP